MKRLMVALTMMIPAGCDAPDDELEGPIVVDLDENEDALEDGRGSGSTVSYAFMSTGIGGYFTMAASASKAEVLPDAQLAADDAPQEGLSYLAWMQAANDWMEDATEWWCSDNPPTPAQCVSACGGIGMSWSGTYGPQGAQAVISGWPTYQTTTVSIVQPIGLVADTVVCTASSPCWWGEVDINATDKPTCDCDCEL